MEDLNRKIESQTLPLSDMQEVMLIHYMINPDSKRYFEQINYAIEGDIDDKVFERSWQEIINANEMLRVHYRLKPNIKQILSLNNTKIEIYHLEWMDRECAEKSASQMSKITLINDVNLDENPFVVCLYHIDSHFSIMSISNHHILYDGWSSMLLMKEWKKVYLGLLYGRTLDSVIRLKKSYAQYVQLCKNDRPKDTMKFWTEYLKGYEGVEYPHETGKAEWMLNIMLQSDQHDKLRLFLKKENVTLAVLIYFVWSILLARQSNIVDVMFGITMTNRPLDMLDVVGLFINTLPLRICMDMEISLLEQLENVKVRVIELMNHSFTSHMDLLEASGMQSNKQLYSSMVVIQNYPMDDSESMENNELSVTYYSKQYMSGMPLSLSVREMDGIWFEFTFDKACFDEETVQSTMLHFEYLLNMILDQSEFLDRIKIKDIMKTRLIT